MEGDQYIAHTIKEAFPQQWDTISYLYYIHITSLAAPLIAEDQFVASKSGNITF